MPGYNLTLDGAVIEFLMNDCKVSMKVVADTKGTNSLSQAIYDLTKAIQEKGGTVYRGNAERPNEQAKTVYWVNPETNNPEDCPKCKKPLELIPVTYQKGPRVGTKGFRLGHLSKSGCNYNRFINDIDAEVIPEQR